MRGFADAANLDWYFPGSTLCPRAKPRSSGHMIATVLEIPEPGTSSAPEPHAEHTARVAWPDLDPGSLEGAQRSPLRLENCDSPT